MGRWNRGEILSRESRNGIGRHGGPDETHDIKRLRVKKEFIGRVQKRFVVACVVRKSPPSSTVHGRRTMPVQETI